VNIQTIRAGGSGFRHLLWYVGTAYVSGQIRVVNYMRRSRARRRRSVERIRDVGAEQSRAERIGITEIKIEKGAILSQISNIIYLFYMLCEHWSPLLFAYGPMSREVILDCMSTCHKVSLILYMLVGRHFKQVLQ
jgi:hypothetical protein